MSVADCLDVYVLQWVPVDSVAHPVVASTRQAWDDALGASVQLGDLDYNREASTASLDDMVDADVVVSGSDFDDLFLAAFRWNDDDWESPSWFPQGITGSYDAVGGHGLWGSASRRPTAGDRDEPEDGKRFLLVSWYCRNTDQADELGGSGLDDPKGVRISVIDVTGEWEGPIPYRHVLLVRPSVNADGNLDYEELVYDDEDMGVTSVHAGGIAWYGHYLFVGGGSTLYVFDLRRIKAVDVSGDDADDLCGLHDGRYYARGYAYVCPLVGEYVGDSSNAYAFSCLAVDRSSLPHVLVCARYVYDGESLDHSMVVWWELDEDTGLPAVRDAGSPWSRASPMPGDDIEVQRRGAVWTDLRKTQGVLTVDDLLWTARGTRAGPDHTDQLDVQERAASSTVTSFDWPYGCEDMTYSARSGNLWSLTEFIEKRFIFVVKLDDVGG